MRNIVLVGLAVGLSSACSAEQGPKDRTTATVLQALSDAGAACAAGDGAKSPFAGGTGAPATPYVICSLDQLNRIRSTYLSSSFVLHADLDASITNPASPANAGSTWDNSGAGFDPIGNCGADAQCQTSDDIEFTGTFDGHDHTISNLYINRPALWGVGLFGEVSGSGVSIKNVRVTNVNIAGQQVVGAVVGHLIASLDRCESSGTVSAVGFNAGCLVGQIGTVGGGFVTRTISQSSSTCTVAAVAGAAGGLIGDLQWGAEVHESFATGNVTTGGSQAGGLVGDSYQGTIQDSYATGKVQGSTCVGGLLGNGDFSTNTNDYASGSATGTTQVGGLSGCQGNTTTTGVFATTTVAGSSKVGGLYGEKWGGSITGSYWYGGAGQPTVMCGYNRPSEPGTGCSDSFSVTGPLSYWYSRTNAPLSTWSTGIWAFHPDGYPTLINAVAFPPVVPATDAGPDGAIDSGSESGAGGTGGAVGSGGASGGGVGGTAGAPQLDASTDAPAGSDGASSNGGASTMSSGGTSSTGGASSSGGASSTGGASSSGGKASEAGGTPAEDASTALDSGTGGSSSSAGSGCNCRTASTPSYDHGGLFAALSAGLVLGAARRRRRR